MSKLFTITGKDYFEIVLEDGDSTICVQYEGKREAKKGKNEFRLFIEPEYRTNGVEAARELLEYKKNRMGQKRKQKYCPFIDDEEKMYDFQRLSKAEFLDSYSYLTETEYDMTKKVLDAQKHTSWSMKDDVLKELAEYDNYDNDNLGDQAREVIAKVKAGDIHAGLKWLGEQQ